MGVTLDIIRTCICIQLLMSTPNLVTVVGLVVNTVPCCTTPLHCMQASCFILLCAYESGRFFAAVAACAPGLALLHVGSSVHSLRLACLCGPAVTLCGAAARTRSCPALLLLCQAMGLSYADSAMQTCRLVLSLPRCIIS